MNGAIAQRTGESLLVQSIRELARRRTERVLDARCILPVRKRTRKMHLEEIRPAPWRANRQALVLA